jgi:hypothetical protein
MNRTTHYVMIQFIFNPGHFDAVELVFKSAIHLNSGDLNAVPKREC